MGQPTEPQADEATLYTMAADVVAAYVSRNPLPANELPALIESVWKALAGSLPAEAKKAKPTPAVSIRNSISAEYLICLEDGQKFRSLKRHLRTLYNMSPEDYRSKWGLPRNYPMVAPGHSAQRSELAKAIGLGVSGKAPASADR